MNVPSRKEVLAQARAQGLGVLASLPYHAPRELMVACGLHPMELWGPAGVSTLSADAHYQAYTCPIVRNAAAFFLDGQLSEVDGVLVPHGCDALQGMGSVLKDFIKPDRPVFTLYPPRGIGPADEDYLIAELQALGKKLGALSGRPPSEDSLNVALVAEEQADAALASLLDRRDRVALDDQAFYTRVRAREYLPAADFVALAKAVPEGVGPQGTPLMLSGLLPEPMNMLTSINEGGAWVAADDLACGFRRVHPPGNSEEPWRRMAQRILGSPPDPIRAGPFGQRIDALIQRMEDRGCKGLLVYDVTFCEPELFQLPLLRKALAARSLPFLHIEVDLGKGLPGQVLTRIEAFVETLELAS